MQLRKGIQIVGLLALAASFATVGCGSDTRQACSDECTQSERRCSASRNGYEVCGEYDADSCLEWGGLIECTGSESCSNGSCGSTQIGLVLTGELVPAGGVMIAGNLRLSGVFSKDFAGQESKAGALTLEHIEFTSK